MRTMKALRFATVGDIEKVLHVETVEIPVPRAGEVLIEVHAASINPFDVKNVQGSFPLATLPRIPGRKPRGVYRHTRKGCTTQTQVPLHGAGRKRRDQLYGKRDVGEI